MSFIIAKQSLEIILNENIFKSEYKNIITYTDKIREINCKSLEYKASSLYNKLKNSPPNRYRFISTGPQDETYIDIFYRTSLFLDDLIFKNISNKYSSGINKENVCQIIKEKEAIHFIQIQ